MDITSDKLMYPSRKDLDMTTKREKESLLITAQNNVITTNYVQAQINNTQHNSKSELCGYKDETINHIISEYCKLMQKEYKIRHDWVERGSTSNCARNLNLTILPNDICTNQKPF